MAAGIAETVRLVRTGDGGFAFWFGSLVGGGLLVLTGTMLLPRRPTAGFILTAIGCAAGLLGTAWTVVMPVLLVALVIATAKKASATRDVDTAPD